MMAELLERIEALERRMLELKTLIQRLPWSAWRTLRHSDLITRLSGW